MTEGEPKGSQKHVRWQIRGKSHELPPTNRRTTDQSGARELAKHMAVVLGIESDDDIVPLGTLFLEDERRPGFEIPAQNDVHTVSIEHVATEKNTAGP